MSSFANPTKLATRKFRCQTHFATGKNFHADLWLSDVLQKNTVKTFGECDHCRTYGKLTSYQARKFGHLYFIPILPLGAHSQVLRECRHCEIGTHLSMTDLEPIVASLGDQFKSWILAIQEGQTELIPEGETEPVNIGHLISGILDDLYCLKEIESVESISTILTSSNMNYENEVVMGCWNEIQGDLENAKNHFQSAHQSRPEELLPLYKLGTVAAKAGNIQDAEAAFEKYSKLAPDDITPYIELAGLYEGKKDFAGIVRTYDMIYTLNPDVLSDKGMKKVYKKACKKSGITGKFLHEM